MSGITCPECKRAFCSQFSLKRHITLIHGDDRAHSEPAYQIGSGSLEPFIFKLPFTANVSGPTSCGKTYFVKDLLLKCITKISPAPQRIIWLYKRWQPLYDEIRKSVNPKVEFIQGIPLDLEQDTFINPMTRNLIILDDLMSASSKDCRVNELFTEGSHHRNLSVLAINQNLYYNKDPTQRRNCHYLVLFKNPIDKQQVMTLGRQMYPENSHYFIRHFEAATSRPYGYLAVDLKPNTPEHARLRTNILVSQKDDALNTTNEVAMDHSSHESLSERSHLKQKPKSMISCDECGLLFDNITNLQRHVKTWCSNSDTLKRAEVRMDNKPDVAVVDMDSDVESDESEFFSKISKIAWRNLEDDLEKKENKYKERGLSLRDAEKKAHEKITKHVISEFMSEYAEVINDILLLRNGKLHGKVIETVDKHIREGVSNVKAIRMTVRKYKYRIVEYLEPDEAIDIDDSSSDIDDGDQLIDNNADDTDEMNGTDDETI